MAVEKVLKKSVDKSLRRPYGGVPHESEKGKPAAQSMRLRLVRFVETHISLRTDPAKTVSGSHC